MTFTLEDKGEPGTILVCGDCGQRIRHDFDGSIEVSPEAIEAEYQAWVAWLLLKTDNEHECGECSGPATCVDHSEAYAEAQEG